MDHDPVNAKYLAATAKLTRRAFLSGAAAVPASVIDADWTIAAEDKDIDDRADLIFLLAPDERSVIVRRVPPAPSGNGKPKESDDPPLYRDLIIQSASFGPDAWFDMGASENKSAPDRRYLAVRGVSYGRHVRSTKGNSLYIEFEFRRKVGPKKRGESAVRLVWDVGLTTNIWPGNAKSEAFSTEEENRKALHSFIALKERLVETLSAGRIASALTPMFDEHLQATGQMIVSLDGSMTWHLKAAQVATTPLNAFDGKVVGPAEEKCLEVQWLDPTRDGVSSQGRRLVANCPAIWRAPVLFDSEDAAIAGQIDPSPVLKDETGQLFIGQLEPLSSAVTQGGLGTDAIVAIASWPQARMTCSPGSGTSKPSCQGLPIYDVKLSRLRLADKKNSLWRTVIVADAAGRRGAKPTEETQNSHTPEKLKSETSNSDPRSDNAADTTSEKAEPRPVIDLQTAIGRLGIKALPIDTGIATSPEPKDKDEIERRLFEAVAAASIGDRSGVSDRTFYMLADQTIPKKKPLPLAKARRLYVDVSLAQMDVGLCETSDSEFAFEDSHLRLIYSDGRPISKLAIPEVPWSNPDGFLWLGKAAAGAEAAAINLGGAMLTARRVRDLVDLNFRFSDFVLAFAANDDLLVGTIPPVLRPAREECRVLSADGHEVDSRPILAVEFAPQHILEEAFFRPDPEPLPDTEWPTGDGLPTLATLLAETDIAKRIEMRKNIGKAKEALEAASPTAPEKLFTILRAKLAGEKLPEEQKEYIGPFGMSAAAVRAAREWQTERNTRRFTGDTGLIAEILRKAGQVGAPGGPNWTLPELLSAETDAEQIFPLYKLWRDAFRVFVLENHLVDNPFGAEFINSNHRPSPPSELLPEPGLVKDFATSFIETISGRDPLDRLAMARLSSGSRLSFRVNCEPAPGDSSEVNGLSAFPAHNLAQPGPGVQRFGSLSFSLEALTDWSRHEPHVALRAKKLYEPTPSGALPPVAGRVANINDHDILEFQEFNRGVKGADAHLSEVRSSLLKRPSGLETEIELPARVVLSTAQDAVWQSPRKVNRGGRSAGERDVFETDPESDPGEDVESYEPLWTARLLARDAQPSVRAIWSPDMRPEAIGFVSLNDASRPRIAGAPPRGPWAPWVLRREHVDGVRVSPRDVGLASGQSEEASVCTITASDTITRPTMFQRICEIFRLRALYPNSDLHTFRSSLDAYDRHELVLLSSAYGLPVTGKRKQIGDDETVGGELIERSGQFEPGDDYHIVDANADLAYYRPKPLDVQELSLTALGGFLTHDTNFQPPAPALTYDGRPMFDGLSIERWQHQIVLGRDVLATVVYSGYLFPLGHKASLVKLTERIFVKVNKNGSDGGFGVKAVLRQRMFVRISTPLKKYPAVGQPNHGRQWCAEDVTMLTRQTPDIIDPTFELEVSQGTHSPSGRVYLNGAPGLAFWPQTAMTDDARVRFEFLVDGRRARLPLIFADRIAAKNPTALAALLRYYTDLKSVPDIWRRAALGGQTLRFAESAKEGDTSFATQSILLSVEGRRSDDGTNWAGANNVVSNTGVLEGADQPPFYPVMQSAEIRIEQAERMSGSAIGPTTVRFDGKYVKYGFDRAAGNAAAVDDATVQNAGEIFLYVDTATPPEMRMGPNGNQSGGIGRPEMRIVALSRSKGIMGADKGSRAYRRFPGAAAELYPDDVRAGLLSVADFFSLPPSPANTNNVTLAGGLSQNLAEAFQSFFDVDAKLLGVVSFRDLMKLFQLLGGINAMPALKEAVDYGSQALAKLQSGAAEGLDLLRSELLFPLLTLVRTARDQWSKLDARATSGQNDVINEVDEIFAIEAQSLSKLYPEIDRGLTALEVAILKAASETDPLKVLGHLAAVHEAGRQFMRELSRLASNPIERLEQAAQAQFDAADKDLRQQIIALQNAAAGAARALRRAIEAQATMMGRRLLNYIVGWAASQEVMLLVDLLEAASDPDVKQLAKEVRQALAIDVDLSDVPGKLIATPRPFAGDILAAAAETVVKAADDAAKKTLSDLLGVDVSDTDAVAFAKNELRSAVAEYRASLKIAMGHIRAWMTGMEPVAREWQVWAAKIRRIERLIQLLQDLAGVTNPARGFEILLEIGRDYLGVDAGPLQARLRNEQQKIVAWTGPILQRLRDLARDVSNATDIQPRLPGGVFEACLAKTPVRLNPPSEAKKAARAIATAFQATPLHWLAPFATSVADSYDIEIQLNEIAGANLDPRFKKAASSLKDQLQNYRELFCEAVIAVGRAERMHDDVNAAVISLGTGANIEVALQLILRRLKTLADDLAAGLRRVHGLLDAIIVALSEHAPAIADAMVAALAEQIITQAEKDALDKWHADVAHGLLASANVFFRISGSAAGMISSVGIDALTTLEKAVRESLPSYFDPERTEFAGALSGLTSELAALAERIGKLRLDPMSKPSTIASLFGTKLEGTTSTVAEAFGEEGIADTDLIQSAFETVVENYGKLETRIVELPKQIADAALDSVVSQVLDVIERAYERISEIRTKLLAEARKFPMAGPLVVNALLVPPLGAACVPLSESCDKLHEEMEAVAELSASDHPVSQNKAALQSFAASIAGGQSAVETIIQNFQDIWNNLARGNLAALVDIAALRDEVEDLISQLIPVKQTLNYSLGFDFDPAAVKKLTAEVFQPKAPGRFELDMTATIDLIKQKVEMNAVGHISAFDIVLIGKIFDAVTLQFDGIDFSYEAGGSPRFDVHYKDFKIGKKLEFVQKLQSYMTPSKDGSGFFIEPSRDRPGITAGYGLNLGTIQLGGTAFSNVLLAAAADLPFNNEPAVFRFSLGRPLAPFLISVPPFGGGGFVAIYADADGFKGFEASMEFGGVADFSAGPLVAVARITSGFYIRSMRVKVKDKDRTLTDIYATFFVGGAASIWIFEFYASLYVRLGMTSDGAMEGLAVFTFSFSMGIVDYDYSVTVKKRKNALGSDGTQSISRTDIPTEVDTSIITRSTGTTVPNVFSGAVPLSANTLGDFLDYFDLSLTAAGAKK